MAADMEAANLHAAATQRLTRVPILYHDRGVASSGGTSPIPGNGLPVVTAAGTAFLTISTVLSPICCCPAYSCSSNFIWNGVEDTCLDIVFVQ
ncbi:hypothetical protein CEXT_278941 [Caerostris extrusa]|uniref:Uncharacterized protein n=1 Tax=Caerostris extrusa TaxID=172846 RepID=A0AAV4M838_CAEEX|nr:hypothetical protein CEXT_278941 [Caerostris extrusa]